MKIIDPFLKKSGFFLFFPYIKNMAVLKIRTIPDPVLYKKSARVTEFDKKLRDLVRDLFDTMYAESGVGLAAVQVGILTAVIVIDLEKMGHQKGVFVNPELVEASKETVIQEEGCLSVPGLSANLERPRRVKVRYQDVFGNEKYLEGENIMARALVHEMDHLKGEVFIDKLTPEVRQTVEEDIERIKRGLAPRNSSEPEYRKKVRRRNPNPGRSTPPQVRP